MRRRSLKKEREMRERRALMATGRYPTCEIGPVLAFASGLPIDDERVVADALARCNGRSSGMHERRKRSSQGSLTDRANLVAACHSCNLWVEDHPLIAHKLGLVVRPGDDEWDELAATDSKIVRLTQPRAVP